MKNTNLKHHQKDELIYFTFPSFDKYNFISHAFPSRWGGVSTGIYSTLNFILKDDKPENIHQNYEILCNALNMPVDNIVCSALTHGKNIKKVTSADKGKGLIKERDYTDIDGLITNEPNIPITATFADCVPIFFLDPVKKVIGIAHSGWRGTVQKIGAEMVKLMMSDYDCHKENILIGIGPSICQNCFEVEKEVYNEFLQIDCLPKNWVISKSPKYYINLQAIIKKMFLNLGISEKNITTANMCTKCNSDTFFSHRATQGKRGAMAGIIMLKE